MIKFNFRNPYRPDGRTAFNKSRRRSGVYIIKENYKIVYIGHSTKNLYKTLYRHFQTWEHSLQGVITYSRKKKRNIYTVRIVYASPAESMRLEKVMVLKHKPRDNGYMYKDYIPNAQDLKSFRKYMETKGVNYPLKPP